MVYSPRKARLPESANYEDKSRQGGIFSCHSATSVEVLFRMKNTSDWCFLQMKRASRRANLKKRQDGAFYFEIDGGAGGYCLPVRKISMISFYTHSLSVYLDIISVAQIDKSYPSVMTRFQNLDRHARFLFP